MWPFSTKKQESKTPYDVSMEYIDQLTKAREKMLKSYTEALDTGYTHLAKTIKYEIDLVSATVHDEQRIAADLLNIQKYGKDVKIDEGPFRT